MRNLKDDFCLERPEVVARNLWFYPTEEIGRYACSQRPEKNRIACVAELFVREFLKRDSAARQIDSVLRDGELAEFRKLVSEDILDVRVKSELLRDELWSPGNDFSRKCQVKVRQRLIELSGEIAGFIPVFGNRQAFFIPFHFTSGPTAIADFAGNVIAGWQEPFSELFGAESECRCVVHCDQTGLPMPLTGRSLMLPLYLAWLRHTGTLKYNPLRLVATGAVERGKLKAVETMEKAAAFANNFSGAYLFFPESATYCPKDDHQIALPLIFISELKTIMPKYVEAKGLVVPTLRDAMKRLEIIAGERERNYRYWEFLMSRLDNNMQAVKPLRVPKHYLLGLMLKSSIFCHQGNTADALAVNREAQDFAKKHGFIRELRRLEVEEMVDLQDMENFTLIARQSEQLEQNIERLGDHDLQMRYYGTMGQAHCFGTLSGINGFDRNTAKEYFEKAIEHAYALDETPVSMKENNIAHDLNNRFLWYALFAPETPECHCAGTDAEDHIRCELADNKDEYEKNRRHLCRIKALSRYRLYLQDGITRTEGLDRLLLPRDAHWLAAVTGKYVGALEAAAGNTDKAKTIFHEHTRILRGASAPIMRFIQMTILAEAWRSTGEAVYRGEAFEVLETVKENYPNSFGAWESFLNGKSEFPGLKYWY